MAPSAPPPGSATALHPTVIGLIPQTELQVLIGNDFQMAKVNIFAFTVFFSFCAMNSV